MTGTLLPTRLYYMSKALVKICRHTATEVYGIQPTELGWLPAQQVLQGLNMAEFGSKGKGASGKSGARGKGGGGNAPTSRGRREVPYIMDEVIEIVRRGKRAHLGLLFNHDGDVIYIRAWDYHAGLRKARQVADYDFESVPVNPIYHHQLPRVALISAQYSDYRKAVDDGI